MQIGKYTTALREKERKERDHISSLLDKLGEQQNAEKNDEMNRKIVTETIQAEEAIRAKYLEEYGATGETSPGTAPLKKMLTSLTEK